MGMTGLPFRPQASIFGYGLLLKVKCVGMIFQAAAQGGKEHRFTIDGKIVANVKPGQFLLGVFLSTVEKSPLICLDFSDHSTAKRSVAQSWGLQTLST